MLQNENYDIGVKELFNWMHPKDQGACFSLKGNSDISCKAWKNFVVILRSFTKCLKKLAM